jgi:hypothetical protein
MTENLFEKVASNWVRSHAMASERRYYEMVQVRETMQEMGIEPVMTSGIEAFFKRSLYLGLKEAFAGTPEGLTLRSSFYIWIFIGWSRLGLGAASAAAQYDVTHPQ